MVFCIHCTHFRNNGPHWYDQFCGASLREEGIDPVSGNKGYVAVNDLGRRYITDEPYAYARDINTDGTCSLFVGKDAN